MEQLDTAEQIRTNELPSGLFEVPAGAGEDESSAVVAALRRVTGHSLQAALEAGELIFEHVFQRDETLLRARGKKCSSFRKLAAHPELGMSSSSLWRAVAIYELSLRFPELCDYVHTGVGHISVVLGLPPADQFTLLRHTEAQRWTRRKLQKVVTDMRLAQRGAGMLPRSKVVERLAGLEMLTHDLTLDRQLGHLSSPEARHALQLLERIRQRFSEVEGRLHGAASA
jgi:hypothetical protein